MKIKGLLAKRMRRVVLGLILTLIASAETLEPFRNRLTETIDRAVYDTQQRLQRVRQDDRIVIIDIDERSLSEQGRWPWSRSLIAQLVDKTIVTGQAKVLSFDVLFAEAQEDSDLKLVDRLLADPQFQTVNKPLAQLRSGIDPDTQLTNMLKDKPVVLGYYFTSDREGYKSGSLPAPVMDAQALAQQGWKMLSWTGYGANLPIINAASPNAGFFSPRVDNDGLVRELPLLSEYNGQVYESLVSATLRLYLNNASLEFTSLGVAYRDGNQVLDVPLTPELTALIPFAGVGGPKSGRFKYISATDVLKGRVSADVFKSKIAIVGTSTLGLTDLRATPVSASFPGVETHAALLAGALNNSLKTRPVAGHAVMAFTIAVVGVLMSFVLPTMGVIGVVAVTFLGLSTILAWHMMAAVQMGSIFPIGGALVLMLSLMLINIVAGYFVEGRSRRAVLDRFGQYVSPALVAQMASDPKNFRVDGQNKELTILFADIRGFTPLAESMEPQVLREYLNRFLSGMTDVIHRHEGTVDKYMGDAVMAFWGAPIDDAAHADHAVAAGFAMLKEVENINLEFKERGWPLLQIGIGINSGMVRVGDMGSSARRAYTVIGDAVNVAARLESLTKTLKRPIALGAQTKALATSFECRSLGSFPIAGKQAQVEVFEPCHGAAQTSKVSDQLAVQIDQSASNNLPGNCTSSAV
jgi:adenylate cyclase